MVVKYLTKKDTYFDSVTLMLINNDVKSLPGVTQAVVGMGTDYNIASLERLGLLQPELKAATPNDLVICVQAADDGTAASAIAETEKLLSEKRTKSSGAGDYSPPTQTGAFKLLPDANVVLISVPGAHAAAEVRTALESGRHVMLFSDNVSVDEEIELKDLAVKKGLLMMGPDCGTAIINGVPLAFANAVRRGDIGIVAASGTGLQEVSSVIDRLGGGISQAIGVGGRDLSEKVAGRMTIQAVQALNEDPSTKVITLISKPPAAVTFVALLKALKTVKKPVVIYFIGADAAAIRKEGFIAAENLEDAAVQACKLSLKKDFSSLMPQSEIDRLAAGIKLPGKYLRALYSGGTLCDEAQRVLLSDLKEIYSNTPIAGCKKLADAYKSEKHTIIDLGDDEFTRGRAHPMIDPELRKDLLVKESADPSVGLVVFDVVLGYGSHPDMAGELASAIKKVSASKKAANVAWAATICGTEGDPQGYEKQAQTLKEAGVLVFPSNVSLAKFIKKVFGTNPS